MANQDSRHEGKDGSPNKDTGPQGLVLLGRDEIIAVQDQKYEIVDVPEWGGSVRVKGLGGTERDSYEQSCMVGDGKVRRFSLENIRAKLAARTIVDAAGERIFSDADIITLGRKSAAALDRVFESASRLSKLSKKDVEELADDLKNDHSAAA